MDATAGGKILIRIAGAADAPTIGALATRVTREYVLPDQPPAAHAALFDFFSEHGIGTRIAAGHRFHVAEIDGVLAGAIGTRDDAHVHLLFVDTAFQHRGIARALWHAALAACIESARPARITVNSSAYAVPVYRRLGFDVAGAPITGDDIVATPMVYLIEAEESATTRSG